MLIWRFRPAGADADPSKRNFGDELNDYLWPKLLGKNEAAFAAAPGVFYGVGTVLGQRCPQDAPRHVVFGAGLGCAGVPEVDGRWRFYFVRGPHTSEALNDSYYGKRVPWITDPGALVHRFFDPHLTAQSWGDVAFMPRWDSITPGLVESCSKANIFVIDPRWPVADVVDQIRCSRLLLTEALHGAVVADTLRVPWISIYASRGHEFKWRDFCASLDMIWNPIDMATFTLAWARDFAVPQLSAQSVLDDRKRKLDRAVEELNSDLEGGKL